MFWKKKKTSLGEQEAWGTVGIEAGGRHVNG